MRGDIVGSAVESNDIVKKKVCRLLPRNGFRTWDRVSHLRKSINNHEHCVMVTNTREVDDKVHGERGPGSTGNWKWVEKTVGMMVRRFGADRDITWLDKFFLSLEIENPMFSQPRSGRQDDHCGNFLILGCDIPQLVHKGGDYDRVAHPEL